MNEIEELNQWLDEQIKRGEEEGYPSWIEYYSNLKDIHLKECFLISSGDGIYDNPLRSYCINHKDEYDITPYTGSAVYVRKKNI